LGEVLAKSVERDLQSGAMRDSIINLDRAGRNFFGEIQLIDGTDQIKFQVKSGKDSFAPYTLRLNVKGLDSDNADSILAFRFNPLEGIESFLAIVVPIFICVGAFEYFRSMKKIEADFRQFALIKRAELTEQITSQVAHDIRGPVSALNMVMKSSSVLPEEQRLIIRSVTQRINDIANGLLMAGKSNELTASLMSARDSVDPGPVMLVALLDSILSEERVRFSGHPNVEIRGDLTEGYGLFGKINSTNFARVISNLVNNSVEALDGSGQVTVGISAAKNESIITVEDNGKGIPPEILANLGERGVSHGKKGTLSGSGLGVFHARETVERAGGRFLIESTVNVGTKVTISLPKIATPGWFVEKITLPESSVVVSADDDQTIHQIWSGRLNSASRQTDNLRHLNFTSLEQFSLWARANKDDVTQFFVDCEFLGQNANGLDVIGQLDIASKSILVTSRYEEPQIRSRAEAMGVKIIPKGLVPYVPLEIEKSRVKYDAVILDDDRIVSMTWQMSAREHGRSLLCFSTPNEFKASANGIAFNTPLYIDVSLSSGVRGEAVAVEIAQLGFSDIYLATGFEAASIVKPDCVRGVLGKDPVF
jgi:signal transduction histidine kinase